MTTNGTDFALTPPAARKRPVRERLKVPVGPTETIRGRLGLGKKEFALALGVGSGPEPGNAYQLYIAQGRIPLTTALAAEALMRRQAPASDVVFLVRVVKGAPQVTLIEDAQEMSLGGKTYLLVEKR